MLSWVMSLLLGINCGQCSEKQRDFFSIQESYSVHAPHASSSMAEDDLEFEDDVDAKFFKTIEKLPDMMKLHLSGEGVGVSPNFTVGKELSVTELVQMFDRLFQGTNDVIPQERARSRQVEGGKISRARSGNHRPSYETVDCEINEIQCKLSRQMGSKEREDRWN